MPWAYICIKYILGLCPVKNETESNIVYDKELKSCNPKFLLLSMQPFLHIGRQLVRKTDAAARQLGCTYITVFHPN